MVIINITMSIITLNVNVYIYQFKDNDYQIDKMNKKQLYVAQKKSTLNMRT